MLVVELVERTVADFTIFLPRLISALLLLVPLLLLLRIVLSPLLLLLLLPPPTPTISGRRGGMRSLTASKPFASANEVICCVAPNVCSAGITKYRKIFLSLLIFGTIFRVRSSPLRNESLPPERAPTGKAPVGVRPFNASTDSDSSLFQSK